MKITTSYASRGLRRKASQLRFGSLVLSTLLLSGLSAQDLVFAKAEGGGLRSGAHATAALPDGSTLVCGDYSQTATFGVGESNETTLTTSLNSASYVASFKPDGTLNWARNVGDLRSNDGWWAALYAQDMKANPDGSYYVSGHIRNTVRFAAGTSSATDVAGGNNAFLAAFNADGSLKFALSAGGYALVVDHALGVAPDGSCYIGGRYYTYRSSTPMPLGNGVTVPPVTSNYDMFLARYKPDGTADWGVRLASPSTCYARTIEPLADGSVIYGGEYHGSPLTIGNGGTPLATLTNSGRSDIALVRFSATGAVLWAKSVGDSDYDNPSSLCRTADGGFYMGGTFRHHTTFARGESNEVNYTAPGNDWSTRRPFIARYKKTGELVWFKPFAVRSTGRVQLCELPGAGVTMVSPFSGSVVFGSGTPKQTTLTDSGGTQDIFVATFGADSSFGWARNMRRSASGGWFSSYFGPDVTVLPDGSVSVAGDFSNNMEFNPGLSDATVITANPSLNSSNSFVARFLNGDALSINIPEDIAQICDSGTQGATINFVVEVIGVPPSGSRLVVTNETSGTTLLNVAATSGSHGVGPLSLCLGAYDIKVQILDGTKELLAESFEIAIEDTTAPLLFGCSDRTIECAGQATTLYRSLLGIWATDSCDSNPEITFSPAAVPMGTSSVKVTAKDDAGNTSECTINVTVQDTTPPIFTVIPDDIERECTGGSGTSVSFSVSADDVCGVASIVCKDQNGRTIDPDGTLFGDGNYTITCTATDPAGNQRQINFNITVSDNTNPALLTPNDIVVGNDAGECFARVTFQVTATDACDPNVAVTMTVDGTTVQSGDAFPVGTSTVTVKAKDKSGNEAIKTFNITVEDREDPVLSAPATATVVTDCKGLVLAIDAGKIGASATDNCDGSVAVIVSPALLTPGTHTVSLSSTDAAGNEATSSLQVTVLNGAFDCTVLRPLDPNVDNKIRVGRVVPIKIRVSCDNVAESAGLTVTVDQVSEINAAGTPINNEVAEDAGLSSDNTLLFRLVDGHFHYNLQTKGWKTGSGVRHRVDVRVKKAGHVDTVYSVYLINK